jgi:TolB-like protein
MGWTERNAGLPPERRIEFRIGIHLGDVVEEADGDLMGDGVNIAARLEGITEPGEVCLSEDAYRQVRERLKNDFADLGEKALKNIARPIRVYVLKPSSESVPPAASASSTGPQGPPHLTIVVLPFLNMTGDPDQEYFVDRLTESLTTDLSRVGFSVIGRSTAFTYKGKHVDLKKTVRELNVRYVLEGSVQRVSKRLRVSAQFIDAESGNHLWAERFDKPLADLFDMQDEIVSRLANLVKAQLTAAEASRAERASNPGSIDLTLQGWAVSDKGFTPDNLWEARRLFDRALAIDPADVWALIGIANADAVAAITFLPDDRPARLAAAEAAINNALSLAPENAVAHLCLGIIQIHTNRAFQGIREFERALELDRNMANAHAQIGAAKILLGQPEDTEAHIQEALRLSPRDTLVYLWFMFAGWAKIHLGKEEEAVAWLRRSIETNRNFPTSHFFLAAALAHLKRLPEAHSEVRAGLTLDPTFSISRIRANTSSDNPAAIAGRERLIDDWRKAGLPEE